MKKFIIVLIVITLILLIFPSCFTYSKQPLQPYNKRTVKPVKGIIGTWYQGSDTVHIEKESKGISKMTIRSGGDTMVYVVYPTHSHGKSYLNARDVSVLASDTSDYFFLYYELTEHNNKLQLWAVDGLLDAVERGRLKGIQDTTNGDTETVLDDKSAEILKVVDSLVDKNGTQETLYEFMSLRRVSLLGR